LGWLTRQPTQARSTRLSNISGSIEVSMEFKTAFTATKSRTLTIPFVGMPTVRTLLRSVPGIHKESVLSQRLCLISDKLFKLVERPTIEFEVELLASALLDSDLAQVFKSKHGILRVHYLLRYAVVHISRKPSLTARKTLELAFGRWSAFGLQLFAKIGIFRTPVLDLLGVEEPIIRTDSNIDYSPIYSKNYKTSNLLWIMMFKRYMEVKHLISTIIRDSRGLNGPAKIIFVSWRNKECGLNPSFGRSNGSNTMHKVYGNNSLVISHCRERFSLRKDLAFNSFQGFASTVSGALNQRGR
jgi:hypothetical protein